MKRRTFLQLGGMTAATAALAGCRSANEKLIPFLVPPDEGITPGETVYYASACSSCPAGCGILVRTADGRAKKVEGNPLHPVNRGRLCARGQAILQELYHPDRVSQPLKRSGLRGSGEFQRISWEEGLGLLTSRLRSLRQAKATDHLAMLTPHLRGTLADVATTFMRTFGSPHHVSFDLLSPEWLRLANRQSFGQGSLPFYDMAETRYLLSFGADFAEHHLSPVQYGNAFGRMRQGRDTVRGHFTYVGGRMSLTAASADRWMPARPGSEGALALGMARLILAEALFDGATLKAAGFSAERLLASLAAYDLPTVAETTGLSQAAITEVAREFAGTRPALAMAGEAVAFQTNGTEAVRAVQLLNLVAGNLNRPGGVYPDAGSPVGPEGSFGDLLALCERMRSGRIDVALVQGDPCHAIPRATGFQEALTRVGFIVSFSTLLDDTALQADLVLPDHAALESWGDVIPLAGIRTPAVGLMQPAVRPLLDTRPFPEVLLATAHALGGGMATVFPTQSYRDLVKGAMRRRLGRAAGADFETQWVKLLQRGGLFAAQQGVATGYRWSGAAPLPDPEKPRFSGDEKQYPLHLQVYPSIAFYDGRGASLPWLQQLPDTMTSVVWDSWVEINPKTADSLGIAFGDLVEVASPRGSIRLPAVIYPAIRPDMVAIPLGQGHRGGGRYAAGRGANPLDLVAMEIAGKPHAAWNATRVRVARVSADGGLVTAGNPQGSYRSELIEI
ncbi:MAG TPA: molybdopterin-dependent oxidoreductase [Desulfuromonadaceae bacterium]